MKTAAAAEIFSADCRTVWNLVTDNRDFGWRSDLARVEVLDETHFREISKGGAETLFTITEKKPFCRYAFRMENRRFTGRWTGFFTALPQGGTRLAVMEEIQVKNPVMRLLAHLFFHPAKIQRQYLADLRRKLAQTSSDHCARHTG